MKNTVWFLGAGLLAAGCLFSDLEVGGEPGPGAGGEAGEGGVPSSQTNAMGGKSDHAGSSNKGGDPGTSGGTTGEAQGGEPTLGGATTIGGKTSEGGIGANTSDGGEPNTGGGGEGAMTNGGSAGSGGANGGSAGNGGSSGGPGSITDVWPSSGCGKTYSGNTGTTVNNIDTSGQKDADCAAHVLDGSKRCGLWGQAGSSWSVTPIARDYYVNLPTNYDKSKAYPLVIEGPGCGGSGKNVYTYTALASTAIRMGWTPAPTGLVGHGTNPGQGCFDDKEGDDSLDFVFYEKLYDKMEAELCFDRNRVFISGDSTGSWLGNELVCKYAGDKKHPVRGILANTGGLPNTAPYAPTCNNKPMTGMWVHETGDQETPFTGAKFAITRAITVNGCTGVTSYDDAVTNNKLENYPIGGGNPDTTCKKILGCPVDYPLVVCALPGNQHSSHTNVVDPGFPVFLTSLMAK